LPRHLAPSYNFVSSPGSETRQLPPSCYSLQHLRSTEFVAVVCCTPYRRVHRLDAELHETTRMFNDAHVLAFPLLLAPKSTRYLLLQSAKMALHKRPGESVFSFVRCRQSRSPNIREAFPVQQRGLWPPTSRAGAGLQRVLLLRRRARRDSCFSPGVSWRDCGRFVGNPAPKISEANANHHSRCP
jgi:hypothetical protein